MKLFFKKSILAIIIVFSIITSNSMYIPSLVTAGLTNTTLIRHIWRIDINDNVFIATINWSMFEDWGNGIFLLRLPYNYPIYKFGTDSTEYLLNEMEENGFLCNSYLVSNIVLVKNGSVWQAFKGARKVDIELIDHVFDQISKKDILDFLDSLKVYEAILSGCKNKIMITINSPITLNSTTIINAVKRYLSNQDIKIAVIEAATKLYRTLPESFVKEVRAQYDLIDLNNGTIVERVSLGISALGGILGISYEYIDEIAEKYRISKEDALTRILHDILTLKSAPRPSVQRKLLVIVGSGIVPTIKSDVQMTSIDDNGENLKLTSTVSNSRQKLLNTSNENTNNLHGLTPKKNEPDLALFLIIMVVILVIIMVFIAIKTEFSK